jgi:Fe-S-cluster containining protein
MPFLPLPEPEYGELDGKKYANYKVSCPELLPHGRCGIYEHRPQLCKDYAPASDALCVYYQPEGELK